MPIRTNRSFNDPAIGEAFNNLASMFAPPSASDTAAYAAARARNEESARLRDFFELSRDPNADLSTLDRVGVGAGVYNPTQSYRALDMGDATARRGQDVESGDRRYGVDVGARTTLSTNAADNARALTERELMERAALDRQNAEPIKLGQGETAFLPGQTADATGLSPQLSGASKPLSSDEMIAAAMAGMPGFPEQAARDKFAPTLSQVEGQDRRRLVESGAIGESDLVDSIMGERAPVEAIGPGGSPMFMSPGAAVRTGAQPAPRSPMVNVNTGDAPDGKLRGKLDESEGKRLSDLQASAVTSSGLRQDLDLMGQLIEVAPQGPLVGRLAGLFPGASDAGAAFQSIVERAAPGLRVEGSGATSDIEFRGMLNSLPQLRNRPEANRLIASMMRAKADINIKRGDLVTAYQNGDIDASQMRQQLAALNRQSITSPGLQAMIEAVGGGVEPLAGPAAPTAAPSPGTIVDGHRFKGGDPSDPANWELL